MAGQFRCLIDEVQHLRNIEVSHHVIVERVAVIDAIFVGPRPSVIRHGNPRQVATRNEGSTLSGVGTPSVAAHRCRCWCEDIGIPAITVTVVARTPLDGDRYPIG